MATKKCINGHQYDSSIYGDNCPFCPESGHTRVNPASSAETMVNEPGGRDGVPPTISGPTGATKPFSPEDNLEGGHTVIRVIGNQPDADGGRKVVGVLVSYDTNPRGDVFRIYEGRNIIGRDRTCDVCISNDSKISGKHLLILYREVEGVYWAADQNSSNGTYINGQFVSDRAQLSTNDVIVIGATKMVFLGIPEF
jgi:hypothetical protein